MAVFGNHHKLADSATAASGKMAHMSAQNRRNVLRMGLGATLGAVAAGVGVLPRAGAEPAATYQSGSFVSAARGGVRTNWAIARPPGQTGPLRPVIALHGKGSDAATVMAGGVERGLAEAVAAGLPPFAVVAVDGGGSYWHHRASGEDAGAMVLDELIPMLAGQGVDTSRVGFLGWSMGGYGALLLGSRLGPARTAAICAVSPALWTSPGAAAPGAFDDAEDFAANSVWGLPALGSIPIRVDCGNADPFAAATGAFIDQLPNPPAGGFSPGGHDGEFWSAQLPAEISWLAPILVA